MWWTERLEAARVPSGLVNDIAEAFALAKRLGLDPVVQVGGPGRGQGCPGGGPDAARVHSCELPTTASPARRAHRGSASPDRIVINPDERVSCLNQLPNARSSQ